MQNIQKQLADNTCIQNVPQLHNLNKIEATFLNIGTFRYQIKLHVCTTSYHF